MQITLKQRDIELALKMYLASQGISIAGRSFEVLFTAGRKPGGLLAEIEIGEAADIEQQLRHLEAKAETADAPAAPAAPVAEAPVFTPNAEVPIASLATQLKPRTNSVLRSLTGPEERIFPAAAEPTPEPVPEVAQAPEPVVEAAAPVAPVPNPIFGDVDETPAAAPAAADIPAPTKPVSLFA